DALPIFLETLPVEAHGVWGLRKRLRAGGRDPPLHQTIELAAKRNAAIGCERRANPSCLRGVPCGLLIALRPRRRREPVRRNGARGIGAELGLHPLANLPVYVLALDIGARPDLAVDRTRPPVEHAFPGVRRKV